ncbi:MAG: CHC2 zinc finger domain-containing protein [Chloroflexi bacterium]|nr:CHC2 zinc finger domain-containing protein [Chloroflexota bacterium]
MLKEILNRPDLEPGQVEAFAQTFIPRRDCFPKQLPDGTYVTVKKSLDLNLVAAHLYSTVTLGAYALDQDHQARWVCLDADTSDGWQHLLDMAADLTKSPVTPYVEPSRRGGHLWLFTPLVDGTNARAFAKQLLAEHEMKGIEIFPKQTRLKTGPGSFVRLPLGVHRGSGKRYHFINLHGEPLAPTIREQMALLASPALVPMTFIDEVISRVPVIQKLTTPRHIPRRPGSTIDLSRPVSEQIKQSVTVFELVSRFIELDSQARGYCPFHDDQHKSFGVNRSGNYWHCFAGCGGGSVIDFMLKWREMQGQDASFKATLAELARLLL